MTHDDKADGTGPDRYLTAHGTLTADGDDAGRWLDTEHIQGTDWDTLADTLEVHTLWCAARDHAADEAQHALF